MTQISLKESLQNYIDIMLDNVAYTTGEFLVSDILECLENEGYFNTVVGRDRTATPDENGLIHYMHYVQWYDRETKLSMVEWHTTIKIEKNF